MPRLCFHCKWEQDHGSYQSNHVTRHELHYYQCYLVTSHFLRTPQRAPVLMFLDSLNP